jgi:hypothetical protein
MNDGGVNDLLRDLIREERRDQAATTDDGGFTLLGVPLVAQGPDRYGIDLSAVRVFANLSTLVSLLVSEVLDQCGLGTTDVTVNRRLDPSLTPELVQAGVDWITVYARLDAAEHLPAQHRVFARNMQVMFGSLQTSRWGGILFPALFGLDSGDSPGTTAPALLFPFHLESENPTENHYLLLEFNRPGRFLRVTGEDATASRLQLKHIPHRVVDSLTRSCFLPDIHQLASQIHQGILRECFSDRAEYRETDAHRKSLFSALQKGGLDRLTTLCFRWRTEDSEALILGSCSSGPTRDGRAMLSKQLMLLEDPQVTRCLAKGMVIEVTDGLNRAYLDLSRHGTCLNLSMNERRTVRTLGDYLARLPGLDRVAEDRRGSLEGVRLFLVHHITAEVLGLINAFVDAGCEFVTTCFVHYSGVVPDEYLETLLSLPRDEFRFHALKLIGQGTAGGGHYMLSRQYSDVSCLEFLDDVLRDQGLDFAEAMRLTAGHLFLKEAMDCRDRGKRLLLVEDGGYLAPVLNRACLEGRTVEEVFREFRVQAVRPDAHEPGTAVDDPNRPFADWLGEVFAGSVEHTRNGHDANAKVVEHHGRLRFPVGSIAISRLKVDRESRECAFSILSAVETILNGQGLLLSRRRAVVIGAIGAIGSHLMDILHFRLAAGELAGVDIAEPGRARSPVLQARSLDLLDPGFLRDVDLVVGVAGVSVFTEPLLEDILAHGHRPMLVFASGSTKTVEFSHVQAWANRLLGEETPRVAGRPVHLSQEPLRDLQTGVLLGHKVTVRFVAEPPVTKYLYLLGGLTPINFLYYGIPAEMLDSVLCELFRVAVGLVRREREGRPLPPRLLAVDHQISVDAEPL